MEEEKVIEFTEEEISMLQTICRKRMAKEPLNAQIILSILQKMSATEPETITNTPEPQAQSAETHFMPVITGDHNPKQTLIQRILQKFRVAV
ncbi:MAG TPA: hypothetical protein PLE74_07845 [Candidatus Cloacimonadota bacterium]|nr:hypothetical protein [Candidatus Cloacimonadota bacterium]